MRFEIIFVRHAESCANVWQHQTLVGQLIYGDPEITERGMSRSTNKYKMLKEAIDKYLPSYTIGASAMMRAQQTAYHMLAKHVRKPINIIPHICEEGITVNNIPYSKEKQHKIYEDIEPNIITKLNKGKDDRSHQSFLNKSNYSSFLKWANDNLDFFKKGKDGVYRAVIFTHGLFLRHTFPLKNAVPSISSHKAYNNNDFIVVAIGDELEGSEIPHEPNFLYFDTNSVKGSPKSEEGCPAENCRRKLSCKKGGGTIRYRRSKNHTIRLFKS